MVYFKPPLKTSWLRSLPLSTWKLRLFWRDDQRRAVIRLVGLRLFIFQSVANRIIRGAGRRAAGGCAFVLINSCDNLYASIDPRSKHE
jgi:hypothetical protein